MWSARESTLTFFIIYLSFLKLVTKTCLYNADPLKFHFYVVRLGFTGVYIIFLFLRKNVDCGYLLELPLWGSSNEYPQSMFWAEVWKYQFFIWKFSVFGDKKFSVYLSKRVFIMWNLVQVITPILFWMSCEWISVRDSTLTWKYLPTLPFLIGYIWARLSISYKVACAPSKDSDQPVHPCSIIRVFARHSEGKNGSKAPSDGQQRLISLLRWVQSSAQAIFKEMMCPGSYDLVWLEW